MRTERIEWIDSAKGVGILLVMLGHCYIEGKFTFWFYSFHMALFFFMSGYTFRAKEKYVYFFVKKIRTLLVPYAFFVVITMLFNGSLAAMHGSTYDIIGILKLYLIQNRYTLLWFITCLFLSEQCMFALEKIFLKRESNNSIWLISGISNLVLFYVYRKIIGIDLLWNADLVLIGLAFLCFGKWFKETKIIEQIKNNNFLLLGLNLAMISIIFSGYNYFFFGKVDWFSNEFGNAILYMISAVTGVLATIFLLHNIKCKQLSALGRNSMMFYGLHRLIIDNLTFVVYPKLGIEIVSGNCGQVILAFISVTISIILLTIFNYIVMKYMPWCMGKSKKTKK